MRLLLATLLLMLAAPAQALDLYVNNSGSPVCDDTVPRTSNSEANPWCTLLRAVRGQVDNNRNSPDDATNAAQAGDTVYVTAGTYDYDGGAWTTGGSRDPLYDPVNAGTSWGQAIRFVAVGEVILTASVTAEGCSFGSSQPYVEWNGFTATETALWHRNSWVCINVDSVRIYNNKLDSTWDAPAGINHAGIYIHGFRDGLCQEGIGDIHIRNNEISSFNASGPADNNNANGLTIYCTGHSQPVIIENNYIHDNDGYGVYMKSSYIDPLIQPSIIFRKNDFTANDSGGMRIQAWMNLDIVQNIFRVGGFNSLGIWFHATREDAGGSSKPRNVRIVNNTFDSLDYAVGWEGGVNCVDFEGNVIQNNIFTNMADVLYTEGEADCESIANVGQDSLAFNYNVYDYSASWWPAPSVSWATWTTAEPTGYGQDPGSSITADCLYADAAANDFRLCTGVGAPVAGCSAVSPCREGGPNDGIDILDLNNNGDTTDPITIGAYVTNDEIIGITDPDTGPVTGALFLIQ